MTRADKIRGMSDIELANVITEHSFGCEDCCEAYDPMGKYLNIKCDQKCEEHCVTWLQQEVDDATN